MRNFARSATILALVTALFAAACSSPGTAPGSETPGVSEPSPDQPDDGPWEVTIGLATDMTELDPHVSTTNWNRGVWYYNVGERLTTYENGEVLPQLASSWEMANDDTWRFFLQEGVTFHNGEPFNAEAVVFNIERMQDPETGSTIVGFFNNIESAEVVDDYTVDIHTATADPFLPQYPLPFLVMLPPQATTDNPEGVSTAPIGTGPYRAVSVSTDGVVLEKYEDYWGGSPSGPDTVTLVPRPEIATRMAGLQAGELDAVWNVPTELHNQAPRIHVTPSSRNHQLLMNTLNGVTQDVRVREAISLAIDRVGNATAIFGEGNFLPVTCQLVPEGRIGWVDAPDLNEPLPYDPDRARQLLEEADAIGETVRLIVPIGNYPGGEQISEIITQQLQDVGLVVEYLPMDFQSFLDAARTEANSRVELAYIGSTYDTGTVQQPWGYWFQPGTAYLPIDHADYPNLKPAMDGALVEPDPELRDDLFESVARTICEEVLVAPLLQQTSAMGTAADISVEFFDEMLPLARIRRG